VPGCWEYVETGYRWRPGFWLTNQADWVWSPANYIWTPSGYVFVSGFWDRPLERRGLLFAPVRLAADLLDARWTYTPSYVVQPDFLMGALFARPSYCHSYFGDYFEPTYERRGYIPWFDYHLGRSNYSPLFSYYRHQFGDHGWDRNLRDYYAGRASGTIARPPHTWIEQNSAIRNLTNNRTQDTYINKNLNITRRQRENSWGPKSSWHTRWLYQRQPAPGGRRAAMGPGSPAAATTCGWPTPWSLRRGKQADFPKIEWPGQG
jgi:hypothetical protein